MDVRNIVEMTIEKGTTKTRRLGRFDVKALRIRPCACNARSNTVQSGQIPPRRQQEIKGLTIPIHSAIEVGPAALHLDIGLVHPPGFGG